MEYDRYEQNKSLFIASMICLLVSLTLFAFSLIILPALIWNWHYDIPEFTITFREWFRVRYGITDFSAGWLVFLCFFLPALITGLISKITSNDIENQIYNIEPQETASHVELKQDFQESMSLGMKILLLAALVVACVFLVEWLIAIPPPV